MEEDQVEEDLMDHLKDKLEDVVDVEVVVGDVEEAVEDDRDMPSENMYDEMKKQNWNKSKTTVCF